MSKLLNNLHLLIQRQITECGIVVWYDPEKSFTGAVDRLGLEDVTVVKYEDCSNVTTRQTAGKGIARDFATG